ncbi:MerR family transcriptional regulator [Nocardioides fonticola]|uniref:MerR family transcriptional regulator n=1 Tax=Nocardioides fonticola TaxID=450363 RepID=A0ABP7XIQ4_9ACTN
MLTISQLADHAGVTVRTIRHYHAVGLLPEPARDHSGYRRYDAVAVANLIRIRTLAEAGVPLARVEELLRASPEAFAAAVEEIDRRLRRDVRALQEHRRRIARLAAGESLALPESVTSYLELLRQEGFSERLIEVERDSWIMIAAQIEPRLVDTMMHTKRRQFGDGVLRGLYRDFDEIIDAEADDPRLAAVADRISSGIEAAYLDAGSADPDLADLDPALVRLLDAVFLESMPSARRLLELLEERGWRGWTMIERAEAP